MASPATPKITIQQALGSPTRGDFDCFANVFFNNSVTVIAVIGALQAVIFFIGGVDITKAENQQLFDEIIYKRVFAGMTVTMIFGNLYYAWMAIRLMQQTGRTDVTAMPYGINTPAAFAFVFSIMLPTMFGHGQGVSDIDKMEHAWKVGCVANLIGGLISALAGFAGPLLVKIAPRSAMTVALAGIGLTWLGVNVLKDAFGASYAGFLPLAVSILVFFGGVKTDPLPTSVVIILVGSAAGWASQQGWLDGGTSKYVNDAFNNLGFHIPNILPPSALSEVGTVLSNDLGIILPVSLTGAVGTLLNVYGAQEAGDNYPIQESMIVDGLTTMVSAMFGSPLATCVFIGHPQFKSQGGKIYYMLFSAGLFAIFALFGLFAVVKAFIPPYAMAPIILFVGIAINQDMFASAQKRHLPGVILGLCPALCDWVVSSNATTQFPPEIYAMAKGALFIAFIWSSIAIFITDRRYKDAVAWSVGAALLSAIGLIHQSSVDLTFKNFWVGDDPLKYKPMCFCAITMAGAPYKLGDSCPQTCLDERPFTTSPCAFFLGYMFVALFCIIPWALQMQNNPRVPPPIYTEDDLSAGEASLRITQKMSTMNTPLVETQNESNVEMGNAIHGPYDPKIRLHATSNTSEHF